MFRFKDYPKYAGQHSFLSASNYHWLGYDDQKLAERYMALMAAARGTKLHDLARQCIELREKLPRSAKTLNMYVNDAIGFRMKPEQLLFYSPNAFGTADAISFRDDILRIHDLKTGVTPASMNQLLVYDAYFCLDYGIKPGEIQHVHRIYQNNEVVEVTPQADDILPVMDKIQRFDKIINDIKEESYV